MLHHRRAVADHARDQDLVVRKVHVPPDDVLVLVAPVGRLEQIGLSVHLQHEIDDVRHRDVMGVRPRPGSPAEVIAHAVGRNALQRIVQRLDPGRAVAPVGLQAHAVPDPVPQRREPGVVDLEQQSRVDNHLVFDADGVGERVDELFLGLVIVVPPPLQQAQGRGGGQERIAARRIPEGADQEVDLALKQRVALVGDRSRAGQVAGRPAGRAAHAALVVVGEIDPVLGRGQHRRAAGGNGLEAAEPLVDIGDPYPALGQLALVDDVDAGVLLAPDHRFDGRPQLLVGHRLEVSRIDVLGRLQAAHVGRQDPFRAGSHGPPLDAPRPAGQAAEATEAGRGRRTRAISPSRPLISTMSPPCARAMPRAADRPMPMPPVWGFRDGSAR